MKIRVASPDSVAIHLKCNFVISYPCVKISRSCCSGGCTCGGVDVGGVVVRCGSLATRRWYMFSISGGDSENL